MFSLSCNYFKSLQLSSGEDNQFFYPAFRHRFFYPFAERSNTFPVSFNVALTFIGLDRFTCISRIAGLYRDFIYNSNSYKNLFSIHLLPISFCVRGNSELPEEWLEGYPAPGTRTIRKLHKSRTCKTRKCFVKFKLQGVHWLVLGPCLSCTIMTVTINDMATTIKIVDVLNLDGPSVNSENGRRKLGPHNYLRLRYIVKYIFHSLLDIMPCLELNL